MAEPLGVVLLPARLEDFALAAHARDLLAIPRVVALEPSRVRTPRFMREAASMRQAARLRFPGVPRLLVLYHPAQYPLARALLSRRDECELWYIAPDAPEAPEAVGADHSAELSDFDGLAREHAARILTVGGDGAVPDGPVLRARLLELEVISHRPFAPGARLRTRGRAETG